MSNHATGAARADLVDDQKRFLLVREATAFLRVLDRREKLVVKHFVPERRCKDGRYVTVDALDRGIETLDIVVLEVDDVSAVFLGNPRRIGHVPRGCTMVRAARNENLPLLAIRARDHHGHRRGVRAVLAEHRPVGVANLLGERLGKLNHHLARARRRVDLLQLQGRGLLDPLVAVAEQVRAVATHVVDVLVAVDVPEMGPFRFCEVQREIFRQILDALMTVHSARDDLFGSCEPLVLPCQPVHVRLLVKNSFWERQTRYQVS